MSDHPSFMSVLTTWSFEPRIVLILALTGVLYAVGLRELGRRGKLWRLVRRRQALFFALGLLSLALALLSPLDTYDTRLFSLHMAQHLILQQVAPPLLLLGNPIPVLLAGLPLSLVRPMMRAQRRTPWLRGLTHLLRLPAVAWTVYVGSVLGWHIPKLYQATLIHPGLHLLEHLCFIASGVLFWWIVIEPQPGPVRRHPGLRLVFAATTMLPMVLLGGVFALPATVLYPTLAGHAPLWGLAPIDDQRLGGIVMWLLGMPIDIVTASILFFAMMKDDATGGAPRPVRPIDELSDFSLFLRR